MAKVIITLTDDDVGGALLDITGDSPGTEDQSTWTASQKLAYVLVQYVQFVKDATLAEEIKAKV